MRRWWLILLIWGVTAVHTSRVLAHAELISATPAPGSSVAQLSEIRLVFSEPVRAGATIELLQQFVTVAELEPVLDANDATVLQTAVPPLPDGIYTVQWAITSADGHTISGSYSLRINSAPPPPAVPWYQTTWARLGFLLCGVGITFIVLRRWQAPTVPKGGKVS